MLRFCVPQRFIFLTLLLLGACGGVTPAGNETLQQREENKRAAQQGKLFGDIEVTLGEESNPSSNSGNVTDTSFAGAFGEPLGINGDLWSASIDAFSRMPITQLNATSGLISTDWFTPAGKDANIRYRVNVVVLDTQLRSDAIRVNVNREKKTAAGWVPMTKNPALENFLEEAVLSRARARYIARNLNN